MEQEQQEAKFAGMRFLIIDDHKNIRLSLVMALENEGANIVEAASCLEGLKQLGTASAATAHALPFDLILLDIRLPDGSGLDILKKISEKNQSSKVIMISGEGTLNDAFLATQLGAFDFIEKPFAPERILVSVGRCLEFNKIRSHNEKLQERISDNAPMLGQSAKIKELLVTVKKVAPTHGRVLIIGESGTGKELVAKEIHSRSRRSDKSLIKINCAAIPENLIESELFGHEKGAFTGAIKQRKGVFERADGATLFMDEIGELELGVQAKLLRVLQNGELSRIGSEKTINVNVRLIAATNRNLEEMVKNGDFREDLFYRLNVVSLHVAPLRERKSDIPILAKAFLQEICTEHSLGDKSFSNEALEQFCKHSWPGNIRELKNYIERLAILTEEQTISSLFDWEDHSPPSSAEAIPDAQEDLSIDPQEAFHFKTNMIPWHDFHQSAGKNYIKYVLRKSKGNVSEAARLLCLERAYLHRLMRKLGVQRDIVVQ